MENQKTVNKKKMQKHIKINHSIDAIGNSRVYTLQKRTVALHEYFGTNKNERKEKVEKVRNFIFSGAVESGLEEISVEFNKAENEINKRLDHLINQ